MCYNQSMKQKLLKFLYNLSNFLYWAWVVIATPIWIFGIFFVYDSSSILDSMKTIANGIFMYLFIFIVLFYIRKTTKKLLK